MKRIWIRYGHILDPDTGLDGVFDIVIAKGKIESIGNPGPDTKTKDCEVIDVRGKLVTPGLIDIHTHLREPGHEYKETIETGCRAAAHGGFTAICCMPNTSPVNDNQSVTDYIIKKAAKLGSVRVHPSLYT